MSEVKKILVMGNNDGGMYHFRGMLIETLIKQGNEVYISVPNGEYVPFMVKMGCEFIDTPMDRRGMNPIKDVGLFLEYVKTIKRLKPDIVLTYTIKPNIYGGFSCRLLRIPYLVNITGLGTSLENPGMFRCFIMLLYRLGINKSQCTFYQNRTNMYFMIQHNIGGKKKVLLPGSGVDLQLHTLRKYADNDGTIKFLSVMRIMKDKGICELIDCAKIVKSKYSNVAFNLVGDYDDDSYKDLVEEADKGGIIKFLGSSDDVDSIMEDCHCVIHPSYHEGMSNVLLEAAACGRPIIASKIPGCKETFDDGVTGIGCEAKNTESLVHAVETFIKIPYEQKKNMGLLGRKKVEQEFDRKIVISKYINEINNCKGKVKQ